MATPTSPRDISTETSAHLSSKGLTPSQAWLSSFLSTQRPTTPLPAIQRTALFRLVNSDITNSLVPSPGSILPGDILNATVASRRLAGPIAVQVLDKEDVGRSRWSQVEAIEAHERGETTKGREIIRVVPGEAGGAEGSGAEAERMGSAGPHKLLLQDVKGVRVYAFELQLVDGLDKIDIGAKMVLRDIEVSRGVLLLQPGAVQILGGKLEALHEAWKKGLKERLKSTIEERNGE